MNDQPNRSQPADDELRHRWHLVSVAVLDRMDSKAMSQADLVRESGVSDFTVRKVMRGEPGNYRPDRLAKISVALGQSSNWIAEILKRGDAMVRLNADGVPTHIRSAVPLIDRLVDLYPDLHHLADVMDEARAELDRRLASLDQLDDRLARLDKKVSQERQASAGRSERGDRSSGR